MYYVELTYNRPVRVDVLQTVLTAPATTALSTPESVKLEMGVTTTDDDVFLIDQIEKASRTIATWCDRTFGLQQQLQTFRLSGHVKRLRLLQRPVTAIVSIVADGTTLDPSTYEFNPDTGELWYLCNDHRAHWCFSKVLVTYWGGWLLPNDANRTLPLDVEQACNEIVRQRYAARGRDPGVRSDMTEGVGATTYIDPTRAAGAMPETAELLLETYCGSLLG